MIQVSWCNKELVNAEGSSLRLISRSEGCHFESVLVERIKFGTTLLAS